jgi:hypothetical protein
MQAQLIDAKILANYPDFMDWNAPFEFRRHWLVGSEHLAACKEAEMSQKSTLTDKKPEEAILMLPGQGFATPVDRKPMAGGTIALISISVALVVGGGMYFKQRSTQ